MITNNAAMNNLSLYLFVFAYLFAYICTNSYKFLQVQSPIFNSGIFLTMKTLRRRKRKQDLV